ncbi:hypothetical protein pb186bvf_020701 [Paramecium bursaria]
MRGISNSIQFHKKILELQNSIINQISMNIVEDSAKQSLLRDTINQSSVTDLPTQTQQTQAKPSFFEKIKKLFHGDPIQTCNRIINLNGVVEPENNQHNRISNSKYNAFTFLPLVLYEQFHQFINIFYLGLTISQFIDAFKVGFLIGYLGPLALVVLLSVLKELYDDIKRHRRDQQINACLYKRLTQNGLVDVTSGELSVGMIIQVNSNQRIPADLIVLKATEDSVFLRTDQLDGETDWKLRKPLSITQKLDDQFLMSTGIYLKCDPPQDFIYNFYGILNNGLNKEPASLENVMWASTVLANGSIYGLVLYTGKETRMSMNSRQPKTKFGKIDDEINHMSEMLFLSMVILSIIITILSHPPLQFSTISVAFVRYLILLSNIIPISMRVNVEFGKLIYCYKITIDKEIEGTIPRNSNIPESLGRIEYLLTDKTGTLTQNDMIFKKLSLEQQTYTYEDMNILRSAVSSRCKIGEKQDEAVLRDLLLALALCHNVTPTFEDGIKSYQASSPDEIALVKIAESLGIQLESRDQFSITINYNEKQLVYKILNNFPFSSESKRMGILLENNGQYIFYLKGADTVMKQFVHETQRGFIDEECENLAREGLRTLVITQKILSEREYQIWKQKYEQALLAEKNREKEIKRVIDQLEKNMIFLGITGVEDKLQEDVCQTLENIRNAGINVWMLTGDKIETAICIAISSGIKSASQDIYIIKEIEDEQVLAQRLQQFGSRPNALLVIDGVSLTTAFKKESLFFTVSTQAQSVVCCRCSPTQKALVTECIRKYTKKITACIGDGGNDVGMIQSADIGIGIEGKEGKQAALASDFSILKFKCLNQLLLWHGRQSYKRSALLSQFVVHRGLIISIIQTTFMCLYYFLSISIFSGTLVLGYATVYTMFPVFSIIFDEDVENKIAIQFPPLYKTLQKGRDLNSKTFLIWCWKATYQGVVIMILSQIMYKNIFLIVQTVAFTALILTEYCMIFSELNTIHLFQILTTVLSTIIYILTLWLFPELLTVSEIGWILLLNSIIIVLISWLPIFLVQIIMRKLYPDDFEKIMKSVKRKRIRVDLFK